jgi:predicted dehydrogenase
MPPLRIGIIGFQFAAHLHLNYYKPLRGAKVEILAVASRTKGNAEALAKKFGSHAAYSRKWKGAGGGAF